MKTFADAILAAEKVSTKVEKLQALSGLDTASQALLVEACNPYRVYGVKKFDMPTVYANSDPVTSIGAVDYSKFVGLLDELCARNLTGNSAKFAVAQILGSFTKRTADVLARVLVKNLDCGATSNTFEKIYPHLVFPKFELMLAEKIDEKYKWTFPCFVETKYDGMRLVAIVADGKVEYLSRGGKPAEHAEGQFDEELFALAKHMGDPIVVDGEVLGDDFQATVKAKGSKNDANRKALKFFAFDMMYLSEWKVQSCNLSQTARSLRLKEALEHVHKTMPGRIIKSDSELCQNYQQALDKYNRIVQAGGEGVIVKTPHGKYEWDRSENWMKWKLVIDLDLELVGIEEGNGRLAGTVGALLLEGFDENGKHIKCRCGSGLDDKMRAEIWKNPCKYMGRTVKIEAGAVTRAEDGDYWSARWPIFIEFRSDK